MATYSTSEFKPGLKVLLEGEPCSIIENEFVKPGKGQAFNRVRLRNLKTGRVWERTFKSGESIETADVVAREMDFLYSKGDSWHFMDPDSYEQYEADKTVVGDVAQWLIEQARCEVTLWNNAPLAVKAPNFVELPVKRADPGVRGDTVVGGTKPATMSTGAVVRVPLFIEEGDMLRIDTRTGEYQGRVKE